MSYMGRIERIERYRSQLLEELQYCYNCQPWEGGPVWILGSRIWMRELLNDLRIPESMQKEVVEGVECPNCGSSLDLSCDVGIRHQYEIEHDVRVQRARRAYGKRLFEFSQHIQDYPYLGAVHPVGRQILRDMRSFPRIAVTDSSLFRARRLKDGRRYTKDDLRPPDPNKIAVPDGRFNHGGKPHWYLANKPHAAAVEVAAQGDAVVWIQEWHIEQLENILDLRAWDADGVRSFDEPSEGPTDAPLLAVALIFSDHLRLPVQKKTRQPEYIVPRFVADAARQAGYSGILFSSAKHLYDNLVIFDPTTPLVAVGDPKLTEIPQTPDRLFPFSSLDEIEGELETI
jgi:hypothetical protein